MKTNGDIRAKNAPIIAKYGSKLMQCAKNPHPSKKDTRKETSEMNYRGTSYEGGM